MKDSRVVLLIMMIGCSGTPLSAQASNPCSPSAVRGFLGNVLDARSRAYYSLREKIRRNELKLEDPMKYIETKTYLRGETRFPPLSKLQTSDEKIAWFEAFEERATVAGTTKANQVLVSTEFPSLRSVFEDGNAIQKSKLQAWMKRNEKFIDAKYTPKQLKREAQNLALILHDSRLDMAELARMGIPAQRMRKLESKLHAEILEQGMIKILGEDRLLRDAVFKDRLKELLKTKAGVWSISGVTNVSTGLISKYITTGFLFSLPARTFVRVSADDVAEMMLKGLKKVGPEMAKKYAPQMNADLVYNFFRQGLEVASYGSLLWGAGEFAKTHVDFYEEKRLRESGHTPTPTPTAADGNFD